MRKILVIEDDDSFRCSVLSILRQQGFEAREAADGATGMGLACRQIPDLILCDIFMEHTDGYTVLARLRENPATAAIPLILMTGLAGPEGMRHGMALGADDYLIKPFTAAQLRAAIEARFEKQRVLRQQAEKTLADLRENIMVALPQELRTPLVGLMGLTDLVLAEADRLPPQVIGVLQDMAQASRRLQRVCENFLIYAQIEVLAASPAELRARRRKQTFHAREFVKRLAEESAHAAGRTADLVLALEAGQAAIGEDLFTKLASELLDNAFKFSSPGTPVTVSSGTVGDFFILQIEDRGHGMEVEEISTIGAFMQFQRKLYGQQGTGLGLTIARRLAEIHGGSLTLQSEPSHGTSVTVRFPTPGALAESQADSACLAPR